jgi:hypothetical protein
MYTLYFFASELGCPTKCLLWVITYSSRVCYQTKLCLWLCLRSAKCSNLLIALVLSQGLKVSLSLSSLPDDVPEQVKFSHVTRLFTSLSSTSLGHLQRQGRQGAARMFRSSLTARGGLVWPIYNPGRTQRANFKRTHGRTAEVENFLRYLTA